MRDLSWSPDGSLLLAATDASTHVARIENVSTDMAADCAANYIAPGSRTIFQQLLGTYFMPCSDLLSVEWSPDGRLIAVGCASFNRLGLFEFLDRAVPGMRLSSQSIWVGGHVGDVTDVGWHPDGTMLATASDDGDVRIWSWDGTLLDTIPFFQGALKSVEWSPDGQYYCQLEEVTGRLGR